MKVPVNRIKQALSKGNQMHLFKFHFGSLTRSYVIELKRFSPIKEKNNENKRIINMLYH